jgi:hypothetical protein
VPELIKSILHHQIFGEISAFGWRRKHQQRGLPPAHILFWSDFNIQTIAAVERSLRSMSDIQESRSSLIRNADSIILNN